MTTFSEPFRPQIRSDIVFGPPILSGGATVYYMKDSLTNWFYRIGAREYFLISKMDGTRTMEEIEAEYRAAFNRRLSPQSWGQIFGLLNKRFLLTGTADADTLSMLKKEGDKQRNQQGRRWYSRRWSLAHPDRFIEKILPWVRPTFHPAFVYPALIIVVALEVFFFLNLGIAEAELLPGLIRYFSLPFVLLLCGLGCIFLAAHEIAHGLACKHFGGSVQEMGITWRAPFLSAYCKIDDVVLFHNRWHRVYTAFAGIFVNLLMLIPFALLWHLSPANSEGQIISLFVFVSVNVFILVNLIPFIEVDGYLMLKYALSVVDLREYATRIWYFKIMKRFFGKSNATVRFDDPSQQIYLVYGVCSFIYTILFVGFLLFLLITLLHHLLF